MEYEIKVLDISPSNIRKKLKAIGCVRIHNEKLFKRNVFHYVIKMVLHVLEMKVQMLL